MEVKNKGDSNKMISYADLMKELIKENKKLLLENERLKKENEEQKKKLPKKAARAATRSGKA